MPGVHLILDTFPMDHPPDPNLSSLAVDASEQRAAKRHAREDARTRGFAIEAARLLKALHGEQVLIFDVRGLSDVTDYILIASGTSDRQIKSLGEDLKGLGEEHGLTKFGGEVDGQTTWLVLDFVDVIVHLFEPNTRAHYDLEMMWGDAPKVEWETKEGS